jgi:hypothetical protein
MLLLSSPAFAAQSETSSSPIIRTVGAAVSSSNWSGYAVNGTAGSVSLVQGSWTVPSVTCPASGNTYAAVWVGIDGFQSSTVEQTGTSSDCVNGVASYYAWYEFYPSPSVKIGGSISPGDVVGARVWYSGGTFKVLIVDFTTHRSFTASKAVSSAARSSAEFIVEAPLVCSLFRCKLSTLSNFGTVGFGSDYTGVNLTCALVVNGDSGSIGSFGSAVQKITMVSSSNPAQVMAQPSALTPDGQAFTVQWVSAGP